MASSPAGNLRSPLVAPPQIGRETVGADLVERFRVADRGEDVRRRDAAGEGEEPVFVGRWVTAGVPGQREDPAVALLREERHGGGPPGLGADQDQLLVPERSGAQPQMPAGVLDVHPELLLGRRVVADFLQPRHGTPAPAGRVDDEIGGEDLRNAAARARQHADTSDPVAGRRGYQAGYLALVLDRDVAQGPDPVADMSFQARPTRQIRRLTGFAVLAQQVTPEEEPELPRSTRYRDTVRHQVGEQPGEQLVEDLRPARQQPMGVPALRDSLAVQPGLRQRVPFDDRHPPVRIGQHPGREQATHAGTQNRRVITNRLHLRPPRRLQRRGARRRVADTSSRPRWPGPARRPPRDYRG